MKRKYLRGFVAGSLMGIAAGMLLMPELGEDVKSRIVQTGKSMMGNASQMMSNKGRK